MFSLMRWLSEAGKPGVSLPAKLDTSFKANVLFVSS